MPVGVTMIKSVGSYYSVPFSRGGSVGVFCIEVMNNEGAATFDVEVEHKNSADTSWATTGTSFVQWNGDTGLKLVSVAGLKEMIRFKYDVGGDAGDFVHVYVYPPTWMNR